MPSGDVNLRLLLVTVGGAAAMAEIKTKNKITGVKILFIKLKVGLMINDCCIATTDRFIYGRNRKAGTAQGVKTGGDPVLLECETMVGKVF